jgi:hypothetical protein
VSASPPALFKIRGGSVRPFSARRAVEPLGEFDEQKGYRVRLRVVEEDDVALLAESPIATGCRRGCWCKTRGSLSGGLRQRNN